MLDFPVVQGRGFRNVEDGGQVTGFSFQLRNPNYRGGPASMLDGIEVVVDGGIAGTAPGDLERFEHRGVGAELAPQGPRQRLDIRALVTLAQQDSHRRSPRSIGASTRADHYGARGAPGHHSGR